MNEKFAYVAGLIDGEGSVMYKQYLEKKKNRPRPYWTWRVRIDVAMTDRDTIKHLYDTLLCGWWGPRKVRPGRKPQWRWSCSYHAAYEIAKAILPYSITKKKDLEKIVRHYDDNITGLSKLN